MTADHKVLSERCECQTIIDALNFPGNRKKLAKVLGGRIGKPKVIYTDNSHQEFGKACEDLFLESLHVNAAQMGNGMGLLREQYAELRKGHLRYCCNQVWMKNGGQIPWSAAAICETFKISWSDGKTPYERRFGMPCNGTVMPFGAMTEHHTISVKDLSRTASIRSKSLARYISFDMRLHAGRNLERRHLGPQTLENWNRWTHLKSMRKD